jgi:DnaJ-class molecular chaperone
VEIDCYKLLGIASDADEKTIRKAWRLKTKEVHPDVNRSRDAAFKFSRLTDAMNLLLDSPSRLKHDRKWGYYEKAKNKDSNTKQKFSEEQNSKAKRNVDEWTNDYSFAMKEREKQRQRHLAKHRRRQKFIYFLLGIVVVAIFITLWLVFT